MQNLRAVNEHLNERVAALEARLGAAERKASQHADQEREVAMAREALRATKSECLRLQETLEQTAGALAEREREAASLRATLHQQQHDLSGSLSPPHSQARPQSRAFNEQPIGAQIADSLAARVSALSDENENLRERIRLLCEQQQTTPQHSSAIPNGGTPLSHKQPAAINSSTSGVQSADFLSSASDENSETQLHDSLASDSTATSVLRDMSLNGSVSFAPKGYSLQYIFLPQFKFFVC